MATKHLMCSEYCSSSSGGGVSLAAEVPNGAHPLLINPISGQSCSKGCCPAPPITHPPHYFPSKKQQSTNQPMLEVIDPSAFRAFCFRGEGRCNFVISAKDEKNNLRIVWRLAKHRKSGMMTAKPKCEVVNKYLERLISPFLGESYLIRAEVVHIPTDRLHHLAKIPALPHNLKIETWEELKDESKYPSAISFFPTQMLSHAERTGHYVCALQMPDATRIPRQLPFVYGPTITVEIKPKQGFYQLHPGFTDVPYCNNCVLQIEKWKSAAFDAMYDFCPLDLYSGERHRMRSSIDSLIRDPHRNLRIFVDGNAVHDEVSVLPRDDLKAILFPTAPADVDTLISVIACTLAGVSNDFDQSSGDYFHMHEDSVLSDLLRAQKVDTIGIVRAYEYFQNLSPNIQRELLNKSNLLNRGGLSFLKRSDPRSLVERYLLAATMKDCSLMVSVRLVDHCQLDKMTIDNFNGRQQSTQKLICVKATDGRPLYFTYVTRIVDLDPKSPKNLENAYRRFLGGVEAIRSNPKIHKPCSV